MGGTGSTLGPLRTGQPNAMSLPTFQGDPSKYAAFDYSPQINQAAAGIGEDIGLQQSRALGRAAQLGAGRSSGSARTLRDIEAKGQQSLAGVRANAAQQSFQDQLKQMFAENQFSLGVGQLENQKYANEIAARQNEQARRDAALKGLFGPIAGLFGG